MVNPEMFNPKEFEPKLTDKLCLQLVHRSIPKLADTFVLNHRCEVLNQVQFVKGFPIRMCSNRRKGDFNHCEPIRVISTIVERFYNQDRVHICLVAFVSILTVGEELKDNSVERMDSCV